jgi:VWFA-related protein
MRIAAVIVAALALAVAPAAQQPSPRDPQAVFRGGVSSVQVDAYVSDAKGEPVADLTVDDFQLTDSGSPRRITTFAAVSLPIARAEPLPPAAATGAPSPRDVRTNTIPDGRIFVVVVDDLHIDAARTPATRTALHRFVEQDLGPTDMTAIVSTSGRMDASADFTTDRRVLLGAIERVMGEKLPSATVGQIQGARDQHFQDDFKDGAQDSTKKGHALAFGPDPDSQERDARARKTTATVRRLSEFMAGITGRRKALVLVSEGMEYDVSQAIGVNPRKPAPIVAETQDAIRAATRGNVTVYAIDPRGLADASADLIQTSTAFGPVGIASTQDELRVGHDSLRVLADNTGGFAALDQNDLSGAFERIVRENSTYYLLGFSPATDDGRYHPLEVRTRRPGLQVKARPGYFAARPGESLLRGGTKRSPKAALDQALASPLPLADIPLKVFTAAFKDTAAAATIEFAIEVDASRLDFVETNGTWHDALAVVAAMTDENGKAVPAVRDTINLAIAPAMLQQMRTRGLRMIKQASLRPGRYQLRVAVADANGNAGSVLGWLDVPDFSAAALALSELTLTSTAAADMPTVGTKDPRFPTPPGALRDFGRADAVIVGAEIYETGQRPPHAVTIVTQLRQGDRVIAEQSATDDRRELLDRRAFTSRVALSKVEPGTYVLHVEARTSDGQRPAGRDVEIRVH